MHAKENAHRPWLPPLCHYRSHCANPLARPAGPRPSPSQDAVLSSAPHTHHRGASFSADLRDSRRPSVCTDPAILLALTYLGP